MSSQYSCYYLGFKPQNLGPILEQILFKPGNQINFFPNEDFIDFTDEEGDSDVFSKELTQQELITYCQDYDMQYETQYIAFECALRPWFWGTCLLVLSNQGCKMQIFWDDHYLSNLGPKVYNNLGPALLELASLIKSPYMLRGFGASTKGFILEQGILDLDLYALEVALKGLKELYVHPELGGELAESFPAQYKCPGQDGYMEYKLSVVPLEKEKQFAELYRDKYMSLPYCPETGYPEALVYKNSHRPKLFSSIQNLLDGEVNIANFYDYFSEVYYACVDYTFFEYELRFFEAIDTAAINHDDEDGIQIIKDLYQGYLAEHPVFGL